MNCDGRTTINSKKGKQLEYIFIGKQDRAVMSK